MKKHVNVVQKVGSWAFIVGLIVAIIAGFWPLGTVMTTVLIVLGLIVGFLNVTGKETNSFLFAALVLVVMTSLGGQLLSNVQFVGPMLQSIFTAMMLFIVPAALIVALKAIYALAEAE
ncbi:hypothetical protein KY349_03680 [Candidatus Woesearchaeota archaeon]|jgi:hypothetical protein|nr:hypothetical protein [Candidatus Woesearchaeota archaeon]